MKHERPERQRARREQTIEIGALFALLVSVAGWRAAPPVIIALASAPWISVWLLHRARAEHHLIPEDGQHELFDGVRGLYHLPSLLLLSLLFSEYYVVDGSRLVFLGALAGATLAAATAWADTRMRRLSPRLLVPLIVGLAYGVGAAGFLDVLLDRSPATTFRVRVEGARVTQGRTRTHYHLLLAPWGPEVDGSDIGVPEETYDELSHGGRMCVELRPGALGIAWYQAYLCPRARRLERS